MEISFTGSLTLHDIETHRLFYFELTEQPTALYINMSVTPFTSINQSISNELSIALYNPRQEMVACCHNIKRSLLNSDCYNIAFKPGHSSYGAQQNIELIPGRWCFVVDVYRIMPPLVTHLSMDQEVTYRIEVTTHLDPEKIAPQWLSSADYEGSSFKDKKAVEQGRTTKEWYKGYIHAHTFHSDGTWTIEDFCNWVIEQGVDFACLTDHNCWSHILPFFTVAGKNFTPLAGIELTTFRGHANIIVPRDQIAWDPQFEWRHLYSNNLKQQAETALVNVASAIKNNTDGVFIINHPAAPALPLCSGCNWSNHSLFPGDAMGVEVWNGHWPDPSTNNEQALALYYQWLNEGAKLVALSGPDIHGDSEVQREKRIAYTEILAIDNDEYSLIKGIREGQVIISSGTTLRPLITADDEPVEIGQTIKRPSSLHLTLTWENAPKDGSLYIVTDHQRSLFSLTLSDGSETVTKELLETENWLTFELRDSHGQLHALINPIYFSH